MTIVNSRKLALVINTRLLKIRLPQNAISFTGCRLRPERALSLCHSDWYETAYFGCDAYLVADLYHTVNVLVGSRCLFCHCSHLSRSNHDAFVSKPFLHFLWPPSPLCSCPAHHASRAVRG